MVSPILDLNSIYRFKYAYVTIDVANAFA